MVSNSDKYDKYRPKKFLGQNFLVDDNIARKIVSSLDIKPDDTVVEIGPGQGSLTKFLHKLTGDFYAVEIDKAIAEKLQSEYGDSVKLIHKDFLKFDPEELNSPHKIKVIGNIPYNITSQILFRIFDSEKIETALLMMQREVARRLVAEPDTKDYGILAIQTQVNSKAGILFNVPPTAFFPKPKVVSTVVKFDLRQKKKINDRKLFTSIVRQSFGQRRKTMKNSLKKFFEENDLSFEDIDFDFKRRAENVTVDEFIRLSEETASILKK